MKKLGTVALSAVIFGAVVTSATGCSKELIGFDVDLARAVASELGVAVEFIEIDWDVKEAELENKTIDMAWNGFTYTEARDSGYFDEGRNKQIGGLDFSGMYMKNKQVGVVTKANAERYATLDGQKTASSMVAEAGSAGATVIGDVFGLTATSAGKQLDVFTEVAAGTSEMGVIDFVMAGWYVNSETGAYNDTLSVVEIEGAEEEFYAIGCREGSNLPALLNNVLAKLWANGTVKSIATTYGLQDIIVNGFGAYDAEYSMPTDGDWAAIESAGKFVVGYTLFAPMAYYA